MKRSRAHRIVPTLVMAAASAVPAVTAGEILTHASGTTSSLASSQPSASLTTPPEVTATPAARATPVATITSTPARPQSSPTATTHTYQGEAVQDQFGLVQATITVTGKKITDVSISAPQNDQRSAMINSQAVPLLRSETLQAQSPNINLISGATETSQAYAQSLQSALDQPRL